ncbi:MAG: N-acetylmuramoyl-L-alanine amidase [Chlamydiota bacterium]|nr:N-acetylmuramoyl-L-alanine amidase [Chlamydiota bacterium]
MKLFRTILFLPLLALILSGCSNSTHYERVYIPKQGPHRTKEKVTLAPLIPKEDTRLLIVIDAGHGGKDEGTKCPVNPKYQEKDMTLSTARMLDEILQGFGYQTIMTRKDDRFIELSDRAKFANDRRPKLFVSVHYNAADNRAAKGIEVYYYKSEKDRLRSEESKKLAASVLDTVISSTKAKSRGVKHGNFAVIRETNMPAILVEGGFMTNNEEMIKIRDASYMKKIAWGIAQGIKNYLNQSLHGNK